MPESFFCLDKTVKRIRFSILRFKHLFKNIKSIFGKKLINPKHGDAVPVECSKDC